MRNFSSWMILTIAISLNASARTNVEASQEQLKDNLTNSKANYDQYKSNMEISSANVVEATQAIKDLREQRTQLHTNTSNIEKNKAALDKMKVKLTSHRVTEAEKLKKEEAQIAEVRAVLDKLEANKRQREMNLAAYDNKIKEIDNEKTEWDAQRTAAGELGKEINSKETEALAEREKWIDKKKGYRSEALKWYKQAENAQQAQTKFKRLSE